MKKLTVNRKHKYNGEKSVIYKGNSIVKEQLSHRSIQYIDDERYRTEIVLQKNEKECTLKRTGIELESELKFVEGKRTENKFKSNYGVFFIEIITNKICHDNDIITIDYDVISSCEKDGYIIELKVGE